MTIPVLLAVLLLLTLSCPPHIQARPGVVPASQTPASPTNQTENGPEVESRDIAEDDLLNLLSVVEELTEPLKMSESEDSGSNPPPLSDDQTSPMSSKDKKIIPSSSLNPGSLPPAPEPGKKPGSVYDHLMSFRDSMLGTPGLNPDQNSDSQDPSLVVASNTGNVNIDVHYNPVYTVYGHLNTMKDFLLGNSNKTTSEMSEMLFQQPPEALLKAKEAFNANLDLMLRGVKEGMLPKVERIRREAHSERRTFIDVFINFLGALLGRQQCSEIIACRTGKFVGYQVPGAGVIMMILENVIPQSIRSWFNVVKTAVMDTNNNCDVEYLCTLVDDH